MDAFAAALELGSFLPRLAFRIFAMKTPPDSAAVARQIGDLLDGAI